MIKLRQRWGSVKMSDSLIQGTTQAKNALAAAKRSIVHPLVHIVVLNYRNYADTIECVRSLEHLSYPNYQIVIVDNASPNESEAVLRQTFTSHTFIQSGENRGYAAGNNIGLKNALENGAEYVLILNNDTLVTTGFLRQLVEFAESRDIAGVVGPKIVRENGDLDRSCARRRLQLADYFWVAGMGRWLSPQNRWKKRHYYSGEDIFSRPCEVDIISGSCMLLRTKMLQEVGLFDENTFLMYEEFILHEKLRTSKYRTFLVPQAKIVHKGHSAADSMYFRTVFENLKSMRYYLFQCRNFGRVATLMAFSSAALAKSLRCCSAFFRRLARKVFQERRTLNL